MSPILNRELALSINSKLGEKDCHINNEMNQRYFIIIIIHYYLISEGTGSIVLVSLRINRLNGVTLCFGSPSCDHLLQRKDKGIVAACKGKRPMHSDVFNFNPFVTTVDVNIGGVARGVVKSAVVCSGALRMCEKEILGLLVQTDNVSQKINIVRLVCSIYKE